VIIDANPAHAPFNEQFVATHVGLAHRNRELALPASVQMCNTFSSSLENCF
jgi:hypothetical protein